MWTGGNYWQRCVRYNKELNEYIRDEKHVKWGEDSLWQFISRLNTAEERIRKSEHRSMKITQIGTFLAVQWLRLLASNAGGVRLICGQGTKIPHAVQHGQKLKKKKQKKPNWSTKRKKSWKKPHKALSIIQMFWDNISQYHMCN